MFDSRYAEIIKALEYYGLQFDNVKILRKGMENLTIMLKIAARLWRLDINESNKYKRSEFNERI